VQKNGYQLNYPDLELGNKFWKRVQVLSLQRSVGR